MNWKKVLASREGLSGMTTAAGLVIRPTSIFVALPCMHSLFKSILIRYKDQYEVVSVLDLGPWNIDDWSYVFGTARPQAEEGIDKRGRKTNLAGIDLSDGLIRKLEINPSEWGLREIEWTHILVADLIK